MRKHVVFFNRYSDKPHTIKCNCGKLRGEHEVPESLQRQLWMHTRDLPSNLVEVHNFYNGEPLPGHIGRAKPGRRNGASMNTDRIGL